MCKEVLQKDILLEQEKEVCRLVAIVIDVKKKLQEQQNRPCLVSKRETSILPACPPAEYPTCCFPLWMRIVTGMVAV